MLSVQHVGPGTQAPSSCVGDAGDLALSTHVTPEEPALQAGAPAFQSGDTKTLWI